jgi:hypothetical protein
MKMDAMQKQKMRKVAIVHFVLTLVIFLVVLTIPISRLTTDYISVFLFFTTDFLLRNGKSNYNSHCLERLDDCHSALLEHLLRLAFY